ncbi:DUF397 domain-containing protein [Streptomyces johnsoniae]|uniref:DUF397 domain-containing protein n=1 Tax=Streptomyces johnsoniae TaxID=3075532 RepID=A0ABU2SEI4_9ACTN|nr:DUF397 domain-containing protein [Streptomyces sp. DSM 41886]MDT0447383.1 DUF397 domain-containing protein [Streptomyces sp. DSM 41886]
MKSTIDLAGADWVKSSYSSGNGGACLEYAKNIAAAAGIVPVRDSKDLAGPVLTFAAADWTGFVGAVKGGGPAAH